MQVQFSIQSIFANIFCIGFLQLSSAVTYEATALTAVVSHLEWF